MDLNDQPPMCRNADLYAGYELCKNVDGNLHCVTMLGEYGSRTLVFATVIASTVYSVG